jgi:hypothetical protein
MADDEVVIKITVDDSELEAVKRDLGTDTGAGDESKIIDEVTGNQGKDTMLDEAKAHGLIGASLGIGGASKGLGMAKSMTSNPMGALQGIFQNLGFVKNFAKMIPHVALVIMAVEIVPMIIKGIIDQLTKAGSPFDKRFKRIMAKERNAFFNREEQRKRQLGLSPVIMTTISGFRNIGGYGSTWTLKEVREQIGIAPIGLRDKAGGVNY